MVVPGAARTPRTPLKTPLIDVNEADVNSVFHEIWNDDKENQVHLSADQSRLVPRLQMIQSPSQNSPSLRLPSGAHRYQVSLPESRQFSDLNLRPLSNFSLQSNQVEIEVRAVGLNFRDIFAVLKPTEDFLSINTIGDDIAGIVKRVGNSVKQWQVGDHLFWLNVENNGTFQSHRVTDEQNLTRIPSGISFAEAATLPCVFTTAFTSLVDVANVQPENKILIHTASGGVGLCCIELCSKYLGVPLENIICTAGSNRKRNFLRRSYGIVHVFNSRTTEYSKEILERTGGRGVDVVVNTLTNEGFKEATLACLAEQGNFVELSKLNVWRNEDVVELRPNVNYDIVDVSSFSNEQCGKLMKTLTKLLETRKMSPLPYTRFDGQDLPQALEYFQRAKQIGKIVCEMPHINIEQGTRLISTQMFNENGTYLITGGLGGIGFEVAKWMLKQGAKNLLLIGRNPPNLDLQREIERLTGEGQAHVVTKEVDIANYDELKCLLANLKDVNLPSLKGVMHCAGILEDGAITSFDWTRFSAPLKSKVDGSWNLHRLATELNAKLEHFVIFSSIASTLGTPGQSNYAAGNCFEDALAHYRHSIGLPATSVNWAAWSEVGLAKGTDLPGINGISTEQGLATLEHVMKSHTIQTCAMSVSSFQKLTTWIPQALTYLDDKVLKSKLGDAKEVVDPVSAYLTESNAFWSKYDGMKETGEKSELVQGCVERILRSILKLEKNDDIPTDENFLALGVDSLMFIEFKNGIQALLGKRAMVDAATIRESDCLKNLTINLMSLLSSVELESNS